MRFGACLLASPEGQQEQQDAVLFASQTAVSECESERAKEKIKRQMRGKLQTYAACCVLCVVCSVPGKHAQKPNKVRRPESDEL